MSALTRAAAAALALVPALAPVTRAGAGAAPPGAGAADGARAPFALTALRPVAGAAGALFDPRRDYAVFINYELGMHCVGFDVSYCCIIPPYNSVQAQVVRTGVAGAKPRLLCPGDGVRLRTRNHSKPAPITGGSSALMKAMGCIWMVTSGTCAASAAIRAPKAMPAPTSSVRPGAISARMRGTASG